MRQASFLTDQRHPKGADAAIRSLYVLAVANNRNRRAHRHRPHRTTRPRAEVINDRGRNFGVARERPARFNLTTLEPMLEDLHSRLAGVVIECLDWSAFIPRYDGAGTVFYLDPPYWGCEGDYGRDLFGREQFARMAEVLAAIKGRFLLSLNDLPEVRETFSAFTVTPVITTYSVANHTGASTGRAELLITNFSAT